MTGSFTPPSVAIPAIPSEAPAMVCSRSSTKPLDAVLAAVEAQRDMRNVSWGPTGRLQLRFGIHTGLTRARGENDYFGPALPTATRLQSAANADQILLSDVTVQRLAS
jgi:class 3 adenylate cyclase